MPARHREILKSMRQAFPPPVSDPVQDGYVAFSILRALDQVDRLKTNGPILGQPTAPNYEDALAARIGVHGESVEEVVPELVEYLKGMLLWGHPRSQMNVVAFPSIPSVIGVILSSIFNPNLCSEESGWRFAEAEVRVSSVIADLIGYDPQKSGGLFTFGGTGALMYGIKIGLEKAVPGCFRRGLQGEEVVLIASDQSHYACLSVAAWLGIGHENVLKVPTHADNSIDLAALREIAFRAVGEGKRIASLVATMGTTDAFGIDDLVGICRLRDELVQQHALPYRPHVHADAVIGWAWSVFNDYNFQENSLGFRPRTLRALAAAQNRIRHLHLADSMGVDFHKTGYAPYIATLFLARDRNEFHYIARERESMPYLYHSGTYHPGMYTLETSRGGGGPMAALANLLLFGKEGFASLLGHAVEMAEILRELISGRPELSVLNDENYGPVTLFRAYPTGTDTFNVKERECQDAQFRDELHRHNELNRRIYDQVHAAALAGRGVAIGLTDSYRKTDYGEPVVALKSYVLSPFADPDRMHVVLDHVLDARTKVEKEMP